MPDSAPKKASANEVKPEDGWTGLDGRRCEHALHALSNFVELVVGKDVSADQLTDLIEVIKVISSFAHRLSPLGVFINTTGFRHKWGGEDPMECCASIYTGS